MSTRTKNLLFALLTMLLAIFLGLTCNAQDCGCNKTSRQFFSCYPDCDFTVIESMEIPGSANELVRIAPRPGEEMDVKLYFEGKTDSLTYLNVEAINFTYQVVELYFFTQDPRPWVARLHDFDSIVIINHRYGPHPTIHRIKQK